MAETQAEVPMPARHPLLWVALAAAIGIVADRYGLANLLGGHLFWWGAATVFILACNWLRWRRAWGSSAYALLLAILALVGAWHHLQWNYLNNNALALFANEVPQPVCVEAIAIDRTKLSPAPPKNPLRAMPTEPRAELEIRITQIRDGTHWRPATGDCRLRVADILAGVTCGDRIRVYAHLARPRPALNPGQYSWAQAERGAGRHCELFCRASECVSILQPAAASPASRWLDKVAALCSDQLSYYVGSEQGDLALAILLGQRERLSQDTMKSFFKTGTIHLLVVSGLHIGMLAAVVWLIVRSGLLSQHLAITIAAGLVIAYASIAGGRPPVVRAAILVVLTFCSLLTARRPNAGNLLAAAAIAVLAYNPSELFRSGTQLSFLCVAALAAYGYRMKRLEPLDPLTRLKRDCESWFFKAARWVGRYFGHIAAASLVVWLAAAPLVAHRFHITTPIGILITPIIWPLVAMTLSTGLAICTVGWILPPLASVLGIVCALSLSAMREIVSLAEQFDLGRIYLAGPTAWWLFVFYAGLAIFMLIPTIRVGWKPAVSLAALWVAVGLTASGVGRQSDQLRCSFLAVGHGTCVVLELPGNQTILYDAGSLVSPEGTSNTIAAFLWSRGITRIDAVVLSHADVDHYNAVPGLLDRFDIGVVYVSPLMFDPWTTKGKLDAPEFLRTTLNDAGIPLREIWMNDRLRTSNPDIEIDVLHPPRFGVAGGDNANSILLYVQYAGHSILLPGDLESPSLEEVTAEPPLDCDILLAPHHGSSHSDPPGFAAWCTPEWVVVSGRRPDADRQITAASYQAEGANVLHTAERGAVVFTMRKQGLEMSTFRPEVPPKQF